MSSGDVGVSVHAGFPNPAADMSLGDLDLNQLLVKHRASTYFFRVQGHEWEAVGIFNGDIAVIDRALDAHKSDAVLWWNEPQGTFAISTLSRMPKTASMWGVITSTIHPLHKQARGES